MKICDVRIRNFRNFSANARAVSFVDPLTQQVRPLSVLVGSNGCGKTTVLDTIEGLLYFAVWMEPNRIANEIRVQGYAHLGVSFVDEAESEEMYGLPLPLEVALGRIQHMPADSAGRERIAALTPKGLAGISDTGDEWHGKILRWTQAMAHEREPLRGGLLYFPHQRWVEYEEKGSIKEPDQAREWLYRFHRGSGWRGSLSQLWV